jgi:hypothetical protein
VLRCKRQAGRIPRHGSVASHAVPHRTINLTHDAAQKFSDQLPAPCDPKEAPERIVAPPEPIERCRRFGSPASRLALVD